MIWGLVVGSLVARDDRDANGFGSAPGDNRQRVVGPLSSS